jgi:hypothetical protein
MPMTPIIPPLPIQKMPVKLLLARTMMKINLAQLLNVDHQLDL